MHAPASSIGETPGKLFHIEINGHEEKNIATRRAPRVENPHG
jgi:hypothetical protein